MQLFLHVLTSLVFVTHALLGCGAHRACEHSTTVNSTVAAHHAEHQCAAHHADLGDEPGQHEGEPSPPCPHSDCSFVKAETQRVDLSHDVTAWIAAIALVGSVHDGGLADAVYEPICRVDLSSTQLYVWHCALII